MAEVSVGDEVRLMIPFRVFKIYEATGLIDICSMEGDCIAVHPNQILILDKQLTMKAMKDAVLKVAQDLAKANNTVTTLEIKNELRRDYPYYFWTQDIVSKYMDQLAGDGVFSYTDNGTYRIYSLVGNTKAVTRSRTKGLTKTVKASSGTITVTNTKPMKVQAKRVTWQRALTLAGNPQFESVTLANGTTVTRNAIKAQKKSPVGYISPKQGRITAITVANTLYNVK